MLLEAKEMDAIFAEEIAKYSYKKNVTFFCEAFFEEKGFGGYSFQVKEFLEGLNEPIVHEFGRKFSVYELSFLTKDLLRYTIKRSIFGDIYNFELAQMHKNIFVTNANVLDLQM